MHSKSISQAVDGVAVGSRNIVRFPGSSQPTSEVRGSLPDLSNHILSKLAPAELKRLVPFLERISLGRDKVLQRSESEDFVYFPESGVIAQLYLLRNGGVTEAALIGSEGLIGLASVLEIKVPQYSSKVIVEGFGFRIKSSVVRQEFLRGGELHRLLIESINKRLAQVSQRAVCNGRHSVNQRLCTWLLMLSDRVAGEAIPLTHKEIAESLGSRRSVITTSVNTLRVKGIIGGNRGEVVILNQRMLKESACECYEVLKQSY